jgi:hypothetical protein
MYECSDSASGSVCLGLPDPHPNPLVHRYESEDPDPRLDPYQNVTDPPQHTGYRYVQHTRRHVGGTLIIRGTLALASARAAPVRPHHRAKGLLLVPILHLKKKITIYAPMIYKALCLMFWIDAISKGIKNSRIPRPNPLPLPLVMDMHASKTLCTGLYKS